MTEQGDDTRVTERRARGLQARDEIMHMTEGPSDLDPLPFHEGVTDFVFAEVWTRPGLSRRDRRWITLTCIGTIGPGRHMDAHVYAALKSGDITIHELREFVLHLAVYSGFPNGSCFNAVIDEQWARVQRENEQSE
jgi:4-carboxymuconolactone decarboxylase